jgi:hypothetical protein
MDLKKRARNFFQKKKKKEFNRTMLFLTIGTLFKEIIVDLAPTQRQPLGRREESCKTDLKEERNLDWTWSRSHLKPSLLQTATTFDRPTLYGQVVWTSKAITKSL